MLIRRCSLQKAQNLARLSRILRVNVSEMVIALGLADSLPSFREYEQVAYDADLDEADIGAIEGLIKLLREKKERREKREQGGF